MRFVNPRRRVATDSKPALQRRFGAAALGFVLSVATGCVSPFPGPGGIIERDLAVPNVTGVSRVLSAGADDTLVELARSNRLGFIEVLAANPGVDPWLPGRGTPIVLPGAHLVPSVPREGIVINLAEQRLYAFEPGEGDRMLSFAIGVSRADSSTPLGETKVVRKRESPTWTPPRSARLEDPSLPDVVPPGPENPLGTHALYLDWPQYLIHGTNEPYGVGRRVSRGCIRLYPEDIARLYPLIPVGTPVRVIHDPVKLQVVRGELFLEVHPTLEQAGELEETGSFTASEVRGLRARVESLAGSVSTGAELLARVDWALVERVGRERRGFPIRVSR